MSLDELVDEVCKKIGRNVLLFQQLEYFLKYIVANGSISGYSSKIKEKQAQHVSCVKKKTMGSLVGQYVEHINPDFKKPTEPEALTEPFLSINIHLEPNQGFYETKKEDLAKLVDERNQLVHNMLPEFNKTSEESCSTLIEKLDKQCEKLRSEIKQIESIAMAFKEARKKMAAYLNSEEGIKQFKLSFINHLLGDLADQIKRPDGWASVQRADQILRQRVPEELAVLKKEYGYSLENIIHETGLFDINEEDTAKGGTRILYRLKPASSGS